VVTEALAGAAHHGGVTQSHSRYDVLRLLGERKDLLLRTTNAALETEDGAGSAGNAHERAAVDLEAIIAVHAERELCGRALLETFRIRFGFEARPEDLAVLGRLRKLIRFTLAHR
jgi:hypothetical protein